MDRLFFLFPKNILKKINEFFTNSWKWNKWDTIFGKKILLIVNSFINLDDIPFILKLSSIKIISFYLDMDYSYSIINWFKYS